jgi:hypothetical protein
VGQRTGQALKSLKKHVRIVEPFPPPGGGNILRTKDYFTDPTLELTGRTDYMDLTDVRNTLIRTDKGFTGFGGPVQTRRKPQGPVRRPQASVKSRNYPGLLPEG